MTLCTVAIPVFNRARLVRHAIESALAQKLEGLEILVVDNSSTDETWEVLHSYQDDRLRLERNPRNLGLVGNLNRCLTLATGRYLRLLCSDDRLVPGTLKQEIELLEAYPTVALLSGRNRLIDESGKFKKILDHYLRPGVYAGSEAIYGMLWIHAYYARNPLNFISGMMLRRKAALEAGVFDETVPLYLDLDFVLRALQFGDLAVWSGIGAEVLVHPNQEGTLLGSAAACGDLVQIAEKYGNLFRERGTYKRMHEQFAGLSLLMAIDNLFRGQFEESRRHLDSDRRGGVSWSGMIRGLARIVSFKLLYLTSGKVILPASFQRSFPLP